MTWLSLKLATDVHLITSNLLEDVEKQNPKKKKEIQKNNQKTDNNFDAELTCHDVQLHCLLPFHYPLTLARLTEALLQKEKRI